jgi:hypothetical protein
MNALKHGRRSRQFAELGALVAQSPRVRQVLLDVAARWDKQSAKADYVASRILSSIIARGLEKGAGGPNRLTVKPPEADGRSIIENLARDGLLEPAPTENPTTPATDNQTPTGPPPDNQTAGTNPID